MCEYVQNKNKNPKATHKLHFKDPWDKSVKNVSCLRFFFTHVTVVHYFSIVYFVLLLSVSYI